MSTHPKDPEDFEIQRGRTQENHKNNCAEGYLPKIGGKVDSAYCQVHHELPVSSVQDASIKKVIPDEDEFKTIRNCLACTKWDIDNKDNVIGLPLKRAFVSKGASKTGLWNLPCHMYGHNQYTAKVKVKLKHQVWNKALKKAEDCKVDFNDLKEELMAASKIWHTFLVDRGTRNGGTETCWKERRYRKEWWVPFSMDPGKPEPVRPPPTLEDFAADMREALSQLFKKQ
jgi:hypothetical protein